MKYHHFELAPKVYQQILVSQSVKSGLQMKRLACQLNLRFAIYAAKGGADGFLAAETTCPGSGLAIAEYS
jgi:hypothetical protein